MSPTPVPSRSISTTSLVSLVARSTRAVRLMGSVSQRGAALRRDLTQCGEEGGGLHGRARRDPQPAGQADVTDQDVVVEQRLPGGGGVAEPAEQHEVGV